MPLDRDIPVGRLEDTATSIPREPPHDFLVEQALLGALLVNNTAFWRVADFLKPEHFADPLHGRIYDACARLIERNHVADHPTLRATFESDLVRLGRPAYLRELAAAAISIVDAGDYGRQIHDLYLRRQLIAVGEAMVNDAHDLGSDVRAAQLIESAEATLYSVASAGTIDDRQQNARASLAATVAAIDQAQREAALPEHERRARDIVTGLRDIDAKLRIRPGNFVVIAGAASMGKAQPLDAKVLTPSGFVEMGSLLRGSVICHPSGGLQTVTHVHPRGVLDVFEIAFIDGRIVRASADHRWSVIAAKGKRHKLRPQIVTTQQIAQMLPRKNHQGRMGVPLCAPQPGFQRSLPIDPYLLGVLLGDGCLTGATPIITSSDEAIFHHIAEVLPADMCFGSVYIRRGTKHVRLKAKVRSGKKSQLALALDDLRLTGKKSADKFVPEIYLTASPEQRFAVLQGLMDTDGTVEPSGTVRFTTVSAQLARDVAYLARSVGATARQRTRTTFYPNRVGDKIPGQLVRVLTIRSTFAAKLFRLERKKRRIPLNYKYPSLRLMIKAVRQVEPAECRCITVSEPDGLYITDDFVVTHNSSMADGIAESNEKRGIPGAIFALEMSAIEWNQRRLARMTGIDTHWMDAGKLRQEEMHRVLDASRELADRPYWIDDNPVLTPTRLRASLRRLKRRHDIRWALVDYLQLMQPERADRRTSSRAEEIASITRALKLTAEELGIALIAVSQIKRGVEARDDQRPTLSDLRESGSIEQDANIVMFCYRREYYLRRSKPTGKGGKPPTEKDHSDYLNELEACAGKAEVIVAKQRQGEAPVVAEVGWDGKRTRFYDLEQTSTGGDGPSAQEALL